jgi:hypothetical protein
MANQHKISGAINGTLTLGQNGYANDVKITTTGSVYGAVVVGSTPGTLSNFGTITGSYGGFGPGAIGISVANGAMLRNAGVVTGGYGGYNPSGYHAYDGGAGVSGAVVDLRNSGQISGGRGGYTSNGGIGSPVHVELGGVGIGVTEGSHVVNSGTITGGNSADAADLAGASTLRNTGVIVGGVGNEGFPGNTGLPAATGGVGVSLSASNMVNLGSITGGTGEAGYARNGRANGIGGAGGAGVNLEGGIVENRGSITGGTGGKGQVNGTVRNPVEDGGNGGAGVYINGGTLSTSGTITGGAAGIGPLGNGQAGAAVVFGSVASTLIDHSTAVFNGNVLGNSTNDTLVLGGLAAGTLSGLGAGTQFTGFTTIAEAPGADWTMSGGVSLAAGTALITDGTLILDSAVSGAGSLDIGARSHVFVADTLATSVSFGAAGDAGLVLDSGSTVTGTISGFAATDRVDLINLVANGASFANGTLSVLENSTTVTTLFLTGDYTSASFSLSSDDHGGTDIHFVAAAAAPVLPRSDPAAGGWSNVLTHGIDRFDMPTLGHWHIQA